MRVLLGMSGGVDSSVAAILLQQQGYEVIGATMQLDDNDKSQTIFDAKNVCDVLGIEHHILNFSKEFKQYVIDNFIKSYNMAITPNPCIECNKFLKFDLMYKKALELGCEFLATGHYAKTVYSKKYNRTVITKSDAGYKDQTYVLYNTDKNIIDKILFPLGNFKNKDEIRKIAQEKGLLIANKPDSQDICFIQDNDYTRFLSDNNSLNAKEGNIIDMKGNILGKHNGLVYYTIGQRKGLGIAYPVPLYVIKLDVDNNQVIVGVEEELYQNELYANDLNFLIDNIENDMKVQVKIRYSSKGSNAILNVENGVAHCVFENPQRSITKGQSAVFYVDDVLIGGGKII